MILKYLTFSGISAQDWTKQIFLEYLSHICTRTILRYALLTKGLGELGVSASK